MKKTVIFATARILGMAITYQVGKLVGCIKTLKTEVDIIEEACPGFKNNVCEEGIKGAAKGAVYSIMNFDKDK